MKHFFAIALTFLLAQEAVALSCLRPDLARSYQQAAQADEVYVVLYGRFSFDPAELPKGTGAPAPGQDQDTRIKARFVGHGLNKTGFVVPLNRAVVLSVQCWAAWCGGLNSDRPGLAFAQKADDTYVIQVDPCGTRFFADPSDAVIEQAVSCMQGEGCTLQ